MSDFKHYYDLTHKYFDAGMIKDAKLSMVSAVKSHGSENFYELLDLLEILVKIEEIEGFFGQVVHRIFPSIFYMG